MIDERYLLIGKYANFWLFDLHETRDVWMIRAKCEPERFHHARRQRLVRFHQNFGSQPLPRQRPDRPRNPDCLRRGSDSPPVLDSGSKVALTVKGDTPEGDGEFVERIRAEITHLLEGRGFSVDSDGVIACEVTFTVKDTGKKRRYSKDGIVGTGGVEVSERQLLIDSTIKDEDGAILWRNNQTTLPDSLCQRHLRVGDRRVLIGGPMGKSRSHRPENQVSAPPLETECLG